MLHWSVTLHVAITDTRLNPMEKRLFNIINESMPDGIHARGIIDRKKLSPVTVLKYLHVLENEHRLIFHDKVKNQDIYKIKSNSDLMLTDSPSSLFNSDFEDFKKIILRGVQLSKKSDLAEAMEAYHHIINVLNLLKFLRDYMKINPNTPLPRDCEIHISPYAPSPKNFEEFFNNVDALAKKIFKEFNPLIMPFLILQMDNTLNKSVRYIKSLEKYKSQKSKFFINMVDDRVNKKQGTSLRRALKDTKTIKRRN